MLQNNLVHKGYRLTAKVTRLPVQGVSGPAFTATVSLTLVSDDPSEDTHMVPLFAGGGFEFSPQRAVHQAMTHGRNMVDNLIEQRTGSPSTT